jgi:prepilin-type N-terminal cleavage/methylation domain-containing protein
VRRFSKGRLKKGGFSLVEVLVALVIVVVLSGIIFVSYRSLYRVGEEQDSVRDTDEAVTQALNQLSFDLNSATLLKDIEMASPVFADHDNSDELAFCLTERRADQSDHKQYRTLHVTYKVDTHENEPATLLRISQPLSGPDLAVTNALVKNVSTFNVEAYDGTDWLPAWSIPPNKGLPLAARVSIQVKNDSRSQETEIYIPAGDLVEPSIERGSAP